MVANPIILVTRLTPQTRSLVLTIHETALVRASSATHSFNVDQRLVGLVFQQAGTGTKRVRAFGPPTPAHAPLGWYMLTLIDEDPRPAISGWVNLSSPLPSQRRRDLNLSGRTR